MGVCVSSLRVFAGNVEIDRVDYYNQTEGMLSLLQSPAKRVQEFSEGFGCAANADGSPGMTAATIAGANSQKYFETAAGSLVQEPETAVQMPKNILKRPRLEGDAANTKKN